MCGSGKTPPGWFLALLLASATIVAYLPALNSGFIWDDDSHVTQNMSLRSAEGLWKIWTEPGATPQYYPLVHTSFWIEYQLHGARPFGYHLVNVVLHILNALLIVVLLQRLGIPGAWIVGFLFALHPVHVESVAWISERKNVLSGFFYLAAFLAYIRYAPINRPEDERGSFADYLVYLALFCAALLSKTVAASLPAAILLVCYWRHGRLSRRNVVEQVVPFVFALAAGTMTIWLETHQVGAVGEFWDLSVVERFLIAGRAVWFYFGKLVFPVGLVFIYPRWLIDTGAFWQYLFPVAALSAVAALYAARGRFGRGPLVAVLFFGGTLVPALGFFNVYPFRFSFVADHFQYLASIGILLFAGPVFVLFSGRWMRTAVTAAMVVLTTLGFATWHRAHAYSDAITLWRDTLVRNPGAWMAHINLGVELEQSGKVEEAYRHYGRAVEKNPALSGAWNNYAMAAARLGRRPEAIESLLAALRLEPDNAEFTMNLSNILYAEGRLTEALEGYRRVVVLKPDHAAARNNLGALLLAQGDLEGARVQFEAAVKGAPKSARSWAGLGETYERIGRPADAASSYRRALELEPGHRRAAAGLARLGGEN